MRAEDDDEIEASHQAGEAETGEAARSIAEIGVEENAAPPEPVRQEAQFARAAPSAVRPQVGGTGSNEASPDPERFYDADYIPVLERLIAGVVEREGPMPIALLGKRVSGMHGWQRTGRLISAQVSRALGLVELHRESGVEFLWAVGTKADRVGFRPGLDRSIRDISRAELSELYDRHASELSRSEDPVLDLARYAGIARLSADARSYLSECLRWRSAASE